MAASLDTVLNTCLSMLMARVMRDFQSLIQETGLSAAQLQTLMHLHARGPAGVGDIAAYLGVTAAAASQMVERLVRLELVQRTQVIHDRRARRVVLTPRGQGLIRRSLRQRRLRLQRITRQITPRQRPQVARALTVLIEAEQSLEA